MYCEIAPLCGTGMKIAILHMQISGADSLWTKAVEQCHFGTTGYTDYKENKK